MATTIKTRLKTTTGGTPSTTAGELCVNTADKKIFIGNGSASVDLFGNLATTAGKLSQFAATTSAELAGVVSDETGSGSLVFGTSPSISTLAITTTGTADKTAAINMASGVTATNSVASQISLYSYNADSIGTPPAPTSGFCSISSDIINGVDLRIAGNGDPVLNIVNNIISIGDVSGGNGGAVIVVDQTIGVVDISNGAMTTTLNLNGHNILPLSSVVTTAAALSNVSTAQNAFPVGQQTLSVAQNTTYLIEGEWIINSGTTTHTTAIGFTVSGDVMVLTGLEFSVVLWSAAANTITTTQSSIHVSANASTQTVLNATSTAAVTTIKITGVWKNTSNETITPKIKFSAAPGGTNTMGAGSYIRFTPIADPTVGDWT